jgi:hypothetical protein
VSNEEVQLTFCILGTLLAISKNEALSQWRELARKQVLLERADLRLS